MRSLILFALVVAIAACTESTPELEFVAAVDSHHVTTSKADPANNKWYRCSTGGTFATYNAKTLTAGQKKLAARMWPGKHQKYYACVQGCRGKCRGVKRGSLAVSLKKVKAKKKTAHHRVSCSQKCDNKCEKSLCSRACAQKHCYIKLYQHCNYKGYGIVLPKGRYSMHSLMRKGMKNNDVSSIRVIGKCKAHLFQHSNFNGMVLRKDRNDKCFTNDGMRMTQIVVTAHDEEDSLIQSDPWGKHSKSFNDQVSSVVVQNRSAKRCTRSCHRHCTRKCRKVCTKIQRSHHHGNKLLFGRHHGSSLARHHGSKQALSKSLEKVLAKRKALRKAHKKHRSKVAKKLMKKADKKATKKAHMHKVINELIQKARVVAKEKEAKKKAKKAHHHKGKKAKAQEAKASVKKLSAKTQAKNFRALKKKLKHKAKNAQVEKTLKAEKKKAKKLAKKQDKKEHTKLHKKTANHTSSKKAAKSAKHHAKISHAATKLQRKLIHSELKQANAVRQLRSKAHRARKAARHAQYRAQRLLVGYKAKVVRSLEKVAMEEKYMLRIKAGKAKHFHAVQKLAKHKAKKHKKKSAARKKKSAARKKKTAVRLAQLKHHAASVQNKWGKYKKAYAKQMTSIKATFTKRMTGLAKANAANKAKHSLSMKKLAAKYAKQAKSHTAKAAFRAARIKAAAHLFARGAKLAARREKVRNAKEARAKKSLASKEASHKNASRVRLAYARAKEVVRKKKKKSEADSKYRRKMAHAAAMAKKAKSAERSSKKASERNSKAEARTTASSLKADASAKMCNFDECLLGSKCVKTGKKWHLSQTNFVRCTKKKHTSQLGNWAGSPFKESSFPEATYVDPGFTMPKMPTRL